MSRKEHKNKGKKQQKRLINFWAALMSAQH